MLYTLYMLYMFYIEYIPVPTHNEYVEADVFKEKLERGHKTTPHSSVVMPMIKMRIENLLLSSSSSINASFLPVSSLSLQLVV